MLVSRNEIRSALNHYQIMGIIDTLRSGLVGLLLRSRYDGFDVKYGTDTSTVMAMRYDEAPSILESGAILVWDQSKYDITANNRKPKKNKQTP